MFAVYGIHVSRSTEGSSRVNQNVKKNTLDFYPYVILKDRQDHEPANDREVRHHKYSWVSAFHWS
jgi:hypothetical protein